METRDRLLDCALREFSERGYDAVGVQEIVDAAGVTKPTLYHHFGTKQGLLEALVEERLAPLEEALKAAAAYGGDLPKTLTELVSAWLRFAQKHRAVYRLLLSMVHAAPDSVAHRVAAASLRRQQQLVESLFVQAVKGHGNLRGRHERLAASLVGLVNTFVQLVWEGREKATPELVHAIVKQFSYGIYA